MQTQNIKRSISNRWYYLIERLPKCTKQEVQATLQLLHDIVTAKDMLFYCEILKPMDKKSIILMANNLFPIYSAYLTTKSSKYELIIPILSEIVAQRVIPVNKIFVKYGLIELICRHDIHLDEETLGSLLENIINYCDFATLEKSIILDFVHDRLERMSDLLKGSNVEYIQSIVRLAVALILHGDRKEKINDVILKECQELFMLLRTQHLRSATLTSVMKTILFMVDTMYYFNRQQFLDIIRKTNFVDILIALGQLNHPDLECLIFKLLRKIFSAGDFSHYLHLVNGVCVNFLDRILFTKIKPRQHLSYSDTESLHNVMTILLFHVKATNNATSFYPLFTLVANIYELCRQRAYYSSSYSFDQQESSSGVMEVDDTLMEEMARFILLILYYSDEYFYFFAYYLDVNHGLVAYDAVAQVLATKTHDKLCISVLYDLLDAIKDRKGSILHYCEELQIPKMVYEIQLRNPCLENYDQYKYCYNVFDQFSASQVEEKL